MKVVCVKSFPGYLTINRVYDALIPTHLGKVGRLFFESKILYNIIDDTGRVYPYHIGYFETLDKLRNNKITELGII